MNEHVRFYPNIDYRAHPAFRDLGVPVRNDDSIVDAMIEDIDRELDALHNKENNDLALRQAFDVGVSRRIADLATYLNQTTPNPRVQRLLSRAFEDVTIELLDEARIRNDRHRFNRTLSPQAQRVAGDLRRDGVHICGLTDAQKISGKGLPALAGPSAFGYYLAPYFRIPARRLLRDDKLHNNEHQNCPRHEVSLRRDGFALILITVSSVSDIKTP